MIKWRLDSRNPLDSWSKIRVILLVARLMIREILLVARLMIREILLVARLMIREILLVARLDAHLSSFPISS